MKRKSFILSFLILTACFFMSCRHKIELIPEITPDITEEVVYDLQDKETVGKLIENNGKLIIITLKGEILRLDPDNKIIDFLYNFNMEIEPHIFYQNNFLALKQKNINNYAIFNLTGMQVEKTIDNLNSERIIAVDNEILVFKEKDNIFFLDYKNGKTRKELKIEENETYYNSEFQGNNLLLLSNLELHSYDKNNNSIQTRKMKTRPVSEFLLDGSYIYYGSEDRKLVKFSLRSGKTAWKFGLPALLKLKPQRVDRYIGITPEDNNIYFFNNRGSLRWWKSFDSTRLLPPAAMNENVAVFLMNKQFRTMNNKIRFFNYKEQSVVSYEFKYQVESNPVYLKDGLYILCKDLEKKNNYVSKIGNRYAADIEIKPEGVKSLGKSISFVVKPINLIEPAIKAVILDNSQAGVFTKELGKSKNLSFVWIPEKPGDYKLMLEANAENKKDLKTEANFNVIDIDKIVKEYYWELQRDCPKVLPKSKAEEEDKTQSDKNKAGTKKTLKEKKKEAGEEETKVVENEAAKEKDKQDKPGEKTQKKKGKEKGKKKKKNDRVERIPGKKKD